MDIFFIHWVMALGEGAKIIGPESLVDEVKEEISRLINIDSRNLHSRLKRIGGTYEQESNASNI